MITIIALFGILGVIGILGGLPIYYGRPIVFQKRALLILVILSSVAVADTNNLFFGTTIGAVLIIAIVRLRPWLILRATRDQLVDALERAMTGVRAEFEKLGTGTYSFQNRGRIKLLILGNLTVVTFTLPKDKKANLVQIIFRKFVKSLSVK